MLLLTALLVSCSCHHAFAGPALPSQTCSVSQGCEVHQDNLIQDLEGVELVEECRQLCSDSSECNMFSHFGATSSPLPNHCILLRSCPNLHDCEDYQTESRVCFGSCNEQFEGKVMENELETIIDAVDEPSCLQSCQQNAACSHYTFYTAEDANYPSMCLLLSGLLGPVTSCEHCRTGKPDCSTPDCSFSVGSDAAMQTSFMFTESTGIAVAALGDCEVTVLAVGGGGSGNYAGGGSGFVASATAPVASSQLYASVGGSGQESSLKSVGWGGVGEWTVVEAAPGGDGTNYDGGAGYSGGGAGFGDYIYGNGGLDGGDGEDGDGKGHGGVGSGLDISSISLASFVLSPGVGGEKHYYNTNHFGGGGGGVLVDGEGPQETQYDGEGYGGGRGWSEGKPGPGVVLMEVKGSNK